MKPINSFRVLITLLILSGCSPRDGGVVYLDTQTGTNSSLPSLYTNNGVLHMSWIQMSDDTTAQLFNSYFSGNAWSDPELISQGKNWFINWADYPMVVSNNGSLLTHNLKKSYDAKYAYDIEMNVKPQGAELWSTELPLHRDSTPTEHGFVSAIPYGDRSFYLTWLDGRNMVGEGSSGEMTIRAAEVAFNGEVIKEHLLDDQTCSCCQTSIAMVKKGPIVVYRDRSDEDIRDIYITRMIEGNWTLPQPIFRDGWEIKGCPVNGPHADAFENNLAVAWFTAVEGEPKVKVIFSSDGGATFSEPTVVSDRSPIGRVDCIILDNGDALVSWMEPEKDKVNLIAAKVRKEGLLSEPIIISEMDGSRNSGFPQMELLDEWVYFAWTDVDGEIKSIRSARLPLQAM